MRRLIHQGTISRLAPLVTATVLALGMVVVTPSPRVARAEPLPSHPIMYAEPFCFTDGGAQAVTVRGRNFEPNVRVQVSKYGDLGVSTVASTSAYGTFTAVINLDVDPYYPGEALEARIIAGSDVPPPVATVYINGCGSDALLVATPNCGDPENPAINLHGERFADGSSGGDIYIELTDGVNSQGQGMSIPAASSFDVTLYTGITLGSGAYTVRATQGYLYGEYTWFGYDTFVVPCPVAEIQPVCTNREGGPPDRMTINVTGSSGWVPMTADGYDEVQIVFDPDGEAQEFFFTANPYESEPGIGSDGSFGTLEINPYMRKAGPYTIQVKQQGYGEDPILDMLYTFNIPCRAPSISLDVTCGPPEIIGPVAQRYLLTITGYDFYPNEDVTVVFDADGVAGSSHPPEAVSSLVNPDGTFTLSLDVAARPPATYRVWAYEDARPGRFEASVDFTVPCTALAPLLEVYPLCLPIATNTPLAYVVSVYGSGWIPGQVDFVFDAKGLTPESATTTADEYGFFKVDLQFSGRPPGSYVLTASQSSSTGPLAAAEVVIAVPCEGPTMRITPTSGPRGFVPVVDGQAFPPNAVLILRWTFGIRHDQPMFVTTDENGSFQRQLVIFRSDFTGPRVLTVELETDPLAYPDTVVNYLVTQSTVSPPFSLAGNPFAQPDATIVFRR